MAGIEVGSVSVSVVPDAREFVPRLRSQLSGTGPLGDELGRSIGQRIAAQISDAITNGLQGGTGRARAAAASAGTSTGSAFADTFKARVAEALRTLPDARIDGDTTAVDAKLEEVRARLAALGDATIGVDLNAGEAVAELNRLKAELDELRHESPDVDVQVDIARASAALATIQAELDRINGETATANVDVDDHGSIGRTERDLGGLASLLTSLAPLAIPIGAALVGGLGAVAASAGVAAAGIGVLALGTSGVASTVKLLDQQQKAASSSSAKMGASAASQAAAEASAAAQIASAQRGLVAARANAANAAISSAEQVKNAERSLGDTERQVAQQQVQDAQAVATAEHNLTQANLDAANAQKALNDAREQAVRDLESSANSAADANLSQQQAVIDLANAQTTLTQVNANSQSTDIQKQQAALDVARAQQALVEANQRLAQTTEDNNKAQKAGVDGAPGVVAAQKNVTDTVYQQQQAVQALTAAQTKQRADVVTGSEQVQKAEQSVSDALRAQAVQARQSADSIVNAQAAVAAAMRSAATAAAGTGAAGVSALAGINEQLAKVNPATLAFAKFFRDDIEPAFRKLRESAAAGLLPGLEDGLKALQPLFGPLTTFIGDISRTLGSLFEQMGKALTGPFWTQFFNYVGKVAPPMLETFGKIIGNIAKGFAGLVEAFQPVTDMIGGGLLSLSRQFANFGAGALKSSGFQAFIDYIKTNGPVLMDTLGHIADIIGHLIQGLAPLGAVMLKALDAITGFLSKLSPTQVLLLIGAIGALVALLGGPVTLIVAGVVAAVALLALHWDQLKSGLAPLIAVIRDTFIGVWNALKGAVHSVTAEFASHRAELEQVGRVIGTVVGIMVEAFGTILKVAITIVATEINLLIDTISALVDAFHWCVKEAKVIGAWFAGPFVDFFTQVGNGIVSAWHTITGAFSDAWAWIKGVFGKAWAGVETLLIHPVQAGFDAIKTAWGDVESFLSGAWKTFAGTASKAWSTIASGIGKAFSSVTTLVSGVWTAVEKVFAAGVNFVTQDILNPLISILNDVLGVFGVHISKIGKLSVNTSGSGSSGSTENTGGGTSGGPVKHFAGGGTVPGYAPGLDIVHAMLSPGEGILVPEATRALGGAPGIQAINSMFSNRVASPGHFAGGGTLPVVPTPEQLKLLRDPGSVYGGIGFEGIGAAINKIKDAIRQGAADVAIAALKTAELPVKALLGTGGTPFANTLATGVFNKLNDAVYDFIRGHVKKPTVGAGGTIPTGEHLALIQQALGLAHVADTAANESAVNTIVTYESGWNPNAINLTDSNAAAGHPSQGLMQTIPGTFEAYRLASLPDVITDPLANLVAGIRYAVSRYGSLTNVPGVVGVANGTGYVGYDAGGVLEPGYHLTYNGTGQNEIITPEKTFEQYVNSKVSDAAGSGFGNVTVIAQFGDETVKAQAHTVIDDRLAVAEQRQRRNTAGGYIRQLAR